MNWICCQIGAREHYAVARALHRHEALEILLTDYWVPPGNLLRTLKRGLRGRFHPDLCDANVTASNLRSTFFELRVRQAGLAEWPLMISRNKWFQEVVQDKLSRINSDGASRILFAYSYAAKGIFEFARARGWRTVLGQIDAGRPDERIVSRLYAEYPGQRGYWERAPPQYWNDWKQECALADRIVVNSAWSRGALEEEGVPSAKIRIVPLAYEGSTDAEDFRREYPDAFTASRPLRVLFLGNIDLRKGVGPIFDAIRLLRGEAVEFWLVGPLKVSVPRDLLETPSIRWIGIVPRNETDRFYRDADIFLFPTFSDGFGLTQLEAQAWRLPIIATKFCGEVVEDGRNGVLLDEPTGTTIAAAIRRYLADPKRLVQFAANAVQRERFSLTQVGEKLLRVFD